MAEKSTSWVDDHMGLIAFVCIAGTCLCLIGLGYLQIQLRGEAARGNAARDRQQLVYPVSVKLYEDAYQRRVITGRDLACFRDSSQCPRPKP